jgi:hypothetical protein
MGPSCHARFPRVVRGLSESYVRVQLAPMFELPKLFHCRKGQPCEARSHVSVKLGSVR